MTNVGLHALARGVCTGLVAFRMQGCCAATEDGVGAVLSKFGRTLQHIDLFGCYLLGTAVVDTIGSHVVGLRSLCLANCTLVDQHAVCSLAAEAPLLEELDLRGCNLVGDLALITLAKHCKLLSKLRLSKCTLVTDAGVVALAECTKLSYLDLAFCKQAGDGGVATFIRSAAGNSSSSSGALQVLDLSSTSITTATVDLVATYCPGLQCLRINQCEAITSASVEAVVEGCSSLRELGLSGCSNVATSDARRLQAGRPGLLLSR